MSRCGIYHSGDLYKRRTHSLRHAGDTLDNKIIVNKVLEFLLGNPACTFDDLLKGCGEFTWEQLFYEVDRLRQLGQLSLMEIGYGRLHLSLSPTTSEGEATSLTPGPNGPSPLLLPYI